MTTFVCGSCRFRFESNIGKPKRCPYCNKPSVSEEKNASEILQEVEDILE